MLRLYNTLTKRVEEFVPRDPERVTFYSCGPTVYDDAHIGNFRSFLAADLLRRWIESPLCELKTESGQRHRGPRRVEQVMNITDVGHMTDDSAADGAGEDKMEAAGRRLAEAKKAGKLPEGADVDPADPFAIARFYEARFREDARKLGLRVATDAETDPSLMPRATDNVPGMITMIQRLIDKGHAYTVGDAGSQIVYFDVESFPSYGALSGNTTDRLRAGAGGRVSDENQAMKRSPADFMLWKADPTHLMKWDSPWGAGYPGWHIECSVMSLARLANGALEAAMDRAGEIDIHSGGEDNIFPHHECEIAQSRCATGSERFARLWFHARFLLVEGEKMSKSKRNFHTARSLFEEGVEPAAIRLELIKTHYRSNADFSRQGLKDSARIIERWRRFIENGAEDTIAPDALRGHAAARAFAGAMHDDLNIAGAIGAVNKWIGETASPAPDDRAALRAIDDVLGLMQLERPESRETGIGLFAPGVDPDPDVIKLLEQRAEARASRDFTRADQIRDEIAAMGLAIKDAPGGKVEVSRA
jgi:cysteinyl-tRNA synthetase